MYKLNAQLMPSLCILLTYQLSLIYTYRDWDQRQSI